MPQLNSPNSLEREADIALLRLVSWAIIRKTRYWLNNHKVPQDAFETAFTEYRPLFNRMGYHGRRGLVPSRRDDPPKDLTFYQSECYEYVFDVLLKNRKLGLPRTLKDMEVFDALCMCVEAIHELETKLDTGVGDL